MKNQIHLSVALVAALAACTFTFGKSANADQTCDPVAQKAGAQIAQVSLQMALQEKNPNIQIQDLVSACFGIGKMAAVTPQEKIKNALDLCVGKSFNLQKAFDEVKPFSGL